METGRRNGSLPAKLLVLAASLFLAFGGLEMLVLVRQYWKYGSASPTVHDFTIDQASSRVLGERRPFEELVAQVAANK